MVEYITGDSVEDRLSWPDAVEALVQGHRRPKAEVGDLFLGRPGQRCSTVPPMSRRSATR